MTLTPEEIGAKMDALGLWKLIEPYNFAICPKGTVFPYFCLALRGEIERVKVRFLMLEGWRTMQYCIRFRNDRNFGYYTSPMEMPHLELVVPAKGTPQLFRHDPGYMPLPANEAQRELAARLLWEAYGVMLRVESDRELPLKFVAEQAVFARVENSSGEWHDEPLIIPDPAPYTESVVLSREDIRKAKDLPLVAEDVLHVDFRMMFGVMTKEPRPRCVYNLVAVDPKTGEKAIDERASAGTDSGLKGLWEAMPVRVLKAFIARGKVPGEIKVRSVRVFRFLRPLCLELPFKLSVQDDLAI